ncbi:MAG: hypothetical protein IPJ82_08055 [Lewinellaceae bacterium]|nr:hypothetical protein [Lewinellaceae bacterium]
MKNSLFALLAAFGLLSLTGCPSPGGDCAVDFRVGESFTLDQGTTACLTGAESFTIRFDSISGDSRCPVGVQCIWAGRVDGVFTLQSGKNTGSTVTLSSGDFGREERPKPGLTVIPSNWTACRRRKKKGNRLCKKTIKRV